MSGEVPKDICGLSPQYHTYERQKCFIAYTEQAEWSDDLLSVCQEVLSRPEFNLEPDYARKHFYPDVPLRQKALELIANARYGIYDLSYWRDEEGEWHLPCNVFIELGMAIALNRPTLLLRHANNRELELPDCLKSVSGHILRFSGETTLKRALLKRLPQWVNAPPERDWWNRYCIFGGRVCEYRESHPRAKQWGQKMLRSHISDGPDVDRDDFRGVVEEVLGRFSDVAFEYLDALPVANSYDFLLCTYCQTVRSTPFAIYRITPRTSAETFVVIGMSIALEAQFGYGISKILLTENVKDVPSLLAGYEVVVARSDKDRKTRLRTFMPTVMQKVRETAWKPRPLPFVEVVTLEPGDLADTSEALAQQILQLLQLADELTQKGENESAIDFLQQAVDLDPANVAAYHRLGQVLAKEERLQEAESCLRQALKIDPSNVAAHHALGRVLVSMGMHDEARVAFQRAIELEPANAMSYYELGRALTQMELPDAAEAAIQQAIEIAPANTMIRSAFAQLLVRKERFQEAEVVLRQVIELDPNNPLGYLSLGQVHARMRDYQRAIDYYARAIELQPDRAATYVSRGIAFRTMNRLPEAIADFQQAVQLDSNDALAYYNWACVSAHREEKDEALELLKRALELSPSLIETARTDSDLVVLRDDPVFRTLIRETQPEESGTEATSILLVEDEPDWQERLVALLDKDEYAVVVSSSYEAALANLERSVFHLVITGNNLSYGRDPQSPPEGMMLAEYISRMEPRIPVIICTAYITAENTRRAFKDLGVVDIIDKVSLDPEELRQTVASALTEGYLSTTASRQAHSKTRKAHVMLVDSDQVYLRFAEETLQAGYDVSTVNSFTKEIVQVGWRRVDLFLINDRFLEDPLVTDLMDQIRRAGPDTRAIAVLSTSARPYEAERAFGLGFWDVVQKPYDGDALLAIVSEALA